MRPWTVTPTETVLLEVVGSHALYHLIVRPKRKREPYTWTITEGAVTYARGQSSMHRLALADCGHASNEIKHRIRKGWPLKDADGRWVAP